MESVGVSKSSEVEPPSTPPTPSTEVSDQPIVAIANEAVEEPLATVDDNEDGDIFIDDDFGLSIKREWEHLRQQQMQIEEEINNIQKETVPVPKPPPPYTPPVSPPATATSDPPKSPRRPPPIKPDPPCYVPSSKDELSEVSRTICQKILSHRSQNLSLSELEFQDLVEMGGEKRSSYSTFLRFVTDLIEQLMSDIFTASREKPNLPWLAGQQKTLMGPRKIHYDDISEESVIKRVIQHVLVAFNYEKRAQKENLIVRWSHKRRDRVDQVLVRELHAEEVSWTDYQDDEIQVKDDISNMIMDALVNDTVQALKNAFMSQQG